MLDKKNYKTIEYYLYNYNRIESMIQDIEDEMLSPSSYSYDNWIKSRHSNTNTLENQVIRPYGEQGKK